MFRGSAGARVPEWRLSSPCVVEQGEHSFQMPDSGQMLQCSSRAQYFFFPGYWGQPVRAWKSAGLPDRDSGSDKRVWRFYPGARSGPSLLGRDRRRHGEALQSSGKGPRIPIFEGFLPRTQSAREHELGELRFEDRTMIFFEAPHRIVETLESIAKIFGGDRSACICRELTKIHEEIIRGDLGSLSLWSKSKEMLGEFTIVVAGAAKNAREKSNTELVEMVRKFESAGMERKEAISEVAKVTGMPKRNVFSAMVDAKSPLD